MRVLLMNQFFWPDSAATSQLLTDVAVDMAAQGHEVHVICADGSYACESAGEAPAVTVHRIPSLRFRRGTVGRVLFYLFFFVQAALRVLLVPRPALVVTLTTPPLLCLLGTLAKYIYGARHSIWEMDVYPDVATSLGYFQPGSLFDRVVGPLADFSRRHCDTILALGPCMRERLARRGVAREKIRVVHNWADGAAVQPQPRPGDPDTLAILYSGNLGLAHDVDTIAGAMLALKASDGYAFIFAGGGPGMQPLRAFCESGGIRNAEFRGYVERASLSDSLCRGDIGLVTERDACCGSVVPSKVYGLLAAGRPLLFVGPADATPALIIRNYACGWHVGCGEQQQLVELLQYLAANKAEVHAAGERARQALLQHFDLPLGVARISAALGLSPAGRANPYRSDERLTAEADSVHRGAPSTAAEQPAR